VCGVCVCVCVWCVCGVCVCGVCVCVCVCVERLVSGLHNLRNLVLAGSQ